MRVFTNLLFKVTLSSTLLTAPAMIDGRTNASGRWLDRDAESPAAAANVIQHFINHLTIWPVRAYVDQKSIVDAFPAVPPETEAPSGTPAIFPATRVIAAATSADAIAAASGNARAAASAGIRAAISAGIRAAASADVRPAASADAPAAASAVTRTAAVVGSLAGYKTAFAFKAAELKRVIRQSAFLYAAIGLEKEGLSAEAFEYAWRGYHNLVKSGAIKRKSVLSIADFSQSSSDKRMYVIDIRHKRLLYRTYVAHGQNSGSEYADSFSNEPESFKSSLGFYVTRTTYVGRNGLSLRLNGVDFGYNDKAMKRNIVLHGCTYVGDQYLENFGATGTSLGCPALPAAISAPIIKTVKNGSCFFIYHPTQDYLDHSVVINE